jgi:chitobiase/beta-hexosaminidase-like protein
MKAAFFSMIKGFLLSAVLLVAVTGCGSGGSTGATSSSGSTSATSETNPSTNIGTGSLAVKVVWNVKGSSALAKATDKVLYAAPAGVVKMRFTVSGAGMTDITKEFDATPGVDGTGTIDNIPAGASRTVKAQGLNSGGTVIYQGSTGGITITAGGTPIPVTVELTEAVPPVTTASLPSGPVDLNQVVTLHANEPATIFYTTNGSDPSTPGSPSGLVNADVPITISADTTLKFFAIDTAGNQEATNTKTYTINVGSLAVSW